MDNRVIADETFKHKLPSAIMFWTSINQNPNEPIFVILLIVFDIKNVKQKV